MSSNSLEKRLSEQPIVLPTNPFWEVIKVFGRDEIIALSVSALGTAVMAQFVSTPLVLALAGPIIEKIGFFIAHLKEALDVYKTTIQPQRLSLLHYLSVGLKNGLNSLLKDVAIHDPIYTLFVYNGLSSYPQTPAWILSITAFIVALGVVAVGEVLVNELRYRLQILKLKKIGFKQESYFESRFYIKNVEAEKVLSDFATEFNLTLKAEADYRDLYFETRLKSYNGRNPLFRLRQRINESNETVQVVYTKVAEVPNKQPGQFNYYPTRKDKFWIRLTQEMPWKIEDIVDKKLRGFCEKITIRSSQNITFTRKVVRNPKNILVSVDQINLDDSTLLTIVEIKSHADKESKRILIQAMRHLMLKYEVIQTTHGKNALSL